MPASSYDPAQSGGSYDAEQHIGPWGTQPVFPLFGDGADNGLPCASVLITRQGRPVFESPRIFDDMKINGARRKVVALMQASTVRPDAIQPP